MSDKLKEQYSFDSSNLLLFMLHWRKPLIVVFIVALLSSVFLSSEWVITPKYRSTVVLYPTSSSSVSQSLLEFSPNNNDVLAFGEEEQTEQMLQILSSNKIRDRVIVKFNLMQHYAINPSAKFSQTDLLKQYESNVSFRRTEFMAVKISVLDEDPRIAAEMANAIAALIDSTKNDMQHERALRGFDIVKAEYAHRSADIKTMEDSLTMLRKFGVHDYESQAEMYNQQYAIELAKGNKSALKALDSKLAVLAEYGGAYVSLSNALEFEREQLSFLKTKFEEAKVNATENLPHTFIVNYAYPSEKKAYPIRWAIVLFSVLSALVLAIVTLIILENIQTFRLKKKVLSTPIKPKSLI